MKCTNGRGECMSGYRQYPVKVLVEQIGEDLVDNMFETWVKPDKYTTYFKYYENNWVRVRLGFMDTWEVAYVEWNDDGNDQIKRMWDEVYAFQIRALIQDSFMKVKVV